MNQRENIAPVLSPQTPIEESCSTDETVESGAVACRNCGSESVQNFCAVCGQAVQLKRINQGYIWHEIQHVLHLDKGIFLTVRELLLRPGKLVREFLAYDRSRIVKPVIYIIISSLIYTLINNWLGMRDVDPSAEATIQGSTGAIFKWVQNYYGYSNIIMGAFIAVWLKLFFRKSVYNFYEIVILLCYVIGMAMLIAAAFSLVEGLVKRDLLILASPISILYCSWAIGQFFGAGRVKSYFKSLAAYLLGMLSFTYAAMILGWSIDRIMQAA